MNLQKMILTNNDCYKAGRTINPKGIMVHSTATPGVMAEEWFSRWNKPGIEVAVHAFVDHTVVCQHLPWLHRAWHCAAQGNNTHIAFEMCEPADWKTNRTYFTACYQNAVELAAFLCREYDLSPQSIISHKEGHAQGIASNHGDPEHWWKYFGYDMNRFRQDVTKMLAGNPSTVTPVTQRAMVQEGSVGADVLHLQKRLNQMRVALKLTYAKLSEDSIFGPKTKEAVLAFQTARKLTVDGIVGPKTWAALAVNYGDVNQDNQVNAVDALQVLQSAVGKRTLSDAGKLAADMNADGKLNAVDASQILKRAVDTP